MRTNENVRGIAATALLLALAGAFADAEELRRFEYTQPQMGVPFRMVFYAPNEEMADTAAKAAFTRISQLNAIMSDYEEDSELSRLSATAGQDRWVPLSRDLWAVLWQAQEFARRSEGAFDVTVGPSVSWWRRARQRKRLPPPEVLEKAQQAVGYEKLLLDPATRSAKLVAPGMRLDLGGIAKGYGVDAGLKVLQILGMRQALVSGGGDLAVGEAPPGRPGWRIEVAPLDVTNAGPAKYVVLTNMALATSGDIFQRLEIDGRRYSHIVDPRTGIGLTDHALVTIISTNCTTADALATAVSVLGPKKGLRLIRDTPGAEAHIVRKPGAKLEFKETRGFARFYEKSPGRPRVVASPKGEASGTVPIRDD
jgi:thiamine biosynthesis lipoprotein